MGTLPRVDELLPPNLLQAFTKKVGQLGQQLDWELKDEAQGDIPVVTEYMYTKFLILSSRRMEKEWQGLTSPLICSRQSLLCLDKGH